MDKTEICKSFVRLLNDLTSKGVDLNNYTDDKQLYDYTMDEYFLFVLCWAGWHTKRQESVWKGVRDSYVCISKKLDKLTPLDVEELCNSYPLPWQKKWLRKLNKFMVDNSSSAKELVFSLRRAGYEQARTQLQGIVETDSEKIVDCWLRDIVKIDAFPIDSRIRKLLKKYKIPEDSNVIIKCCKQNNIPVRSFARAVYEKAEILTKPSVS